MLKDVEEELQRKVKVCVVDHRLSLCLFNEVLQIQILFLNIVYLLLPQSTRIRQGEQRDPEVELEVCGIILLCLEFFCYILFLCESHVYGELFRASKSLTLQFHDKMNRM